MDQTQAQITNLVTENNVLNLGVKRTLREMEDIKIRNFLWYFDNYPHTLPTEVRNELMTECKKEAARRGIEFAD